MTKTGVRCLNNQILILANKIGFCTKSEKGTDTMELSVPFPVSNLTYDGPGEKLDGHIIHRRVMQTCTNIPVVALKRIFL
ncbi:hypothetical protein EV146_111269 [Mesobacillus foraminis]|uniref:Uncharacterized protein n=1 Tax=Mesobacillus foraminis TaxID=279826 RepID=A0A4R2B7B5_9BACI|nr:hypothetical protein EV146_111269 [Mesobacillus foraminis]